MGDKPRVAISIESVRRACMNFRPSPELQKTLDENRRQVVGAALAMCREKRK